MHIYSEDTGQPLIRGGEKQKRHAGMIPPCRNPRKGCPKGTPERPKSLNNQNWRAYLFHKQCEAVGSFPDDEIVRHNAAIIRREEEAAAEQRRSRFEQLVLTVLQPRR